MIAIPKIENANDESILQYLDGNGSNDGVIVGTTQRSVRVGEYHTSLPPRPLCILLAKEACRMVDPAI